MVYSGQYCAYTIILVCFIIWKSVMIYLYFFNSFSHEDWFIILWYIRLLLQMMCCLLYFLASYRHCYCHRRKLLIFVSWASIQQTWSIFSLTLIAYLLTSWVIYIVDQITSNDSLISSLLILMSFFYPFQCYITDIAVISTLKAKFLSIIHIIFIEHTHRRRFLGQRVFYFKTFQIYC